MTKKTKISTENTEILAPQGFRSLGKAIGIKESALDFAVMVADKPCSAAAVFTQNTFCGPCITVGRARLQDNTLQAIVVTSGNANVATGEHGLRNTEEICTLIAQELALAPDNVLPSSTGVIGRPLPMDKIRRAIKGVAQELTPSAWLDAARAILTTDRGPKLRSLKIGHVTLLGMAKGAGMIEPNMATMLAYFFTDAAIAPQELTLLFERVIDRSFNMISVDSDTSTSDTAVILANGHAGSIDLPRFEAALTQMAIALSQDIVRGSEGATKLIEATVKGARSFEQAKRMGKSIINSPLVKTAVFGCDPNWGRIAMAVGKTADPDINPERIRISFGPYVVYDGQDLGAKVLEPLRAYLAQPEITIEVNLGVGQAAATVWGCDLSAEYVRINGEYTT